MLNVGLLCEAPYLETNMSRIKWLIYDMLVVVRKPSYQADW